MAIYMTAQWRCKPGSQEKVLAALKDFVDQVKQNEPDTRIYTALQQANDETGFLTFFVFENEAARERHQSTDWVKRFTEIIYPENLGEITFTKYRLVASTG